MRSENLFTPIIDLPVMKPAVYFRFIKCTPVFHIVQILCDVGFCGVKRLFLCTAAFGKQKGAEFSCFLIPLCVQLAIQFIEGFLKLRCGVAGLINLQYHFSKLVPDSNAPRAMSDAPNTPSNSSNFFERMS